MIYNKDNNRKLENLTIELMNVVEIIAYKY